MTTHDSPPVISPDAFRVLTFDCYGTLIDWETGILNTFRPVLRARGIALSDEAILELYAEFEAALERGPYMRYRDVLGGVMTAFGRRLGFDAVEDERTHAAVSVVHWPPFPDTTAALRRLQQRYRLVILSNVDDDLFAHSARLMGIRFDDVITAQQCGSYKPALNNFEIMLRRVGVPKAQVLHVAQSLFHDHAPAKQLGLTTVWVNRRAGKSGTGATPPAHATPDLTVNNLAELADYLCP